jgi:hypothetical protein
MKNDLAQVLLDEEVREIKKYLDLKTYSIAVLYGSSFGSSGFGGGGSGGGSNFGSSVSSIPDYGIGPGSPDYEARRRPDPISPLSSGINIKREPVFKDPVRVDLDLGNINNTGIDSKELQNLLKDMPNVPSRFGAPEIPAYTPRLSDAVNRGMPSVPSRFGGAGSEKFGLTNPQDFHTGYDMPNLKIQLHLHGPDKNTITHGHIVSYGHKPNEKPLVELNGFKASLASLGAEKIGLKKFK